MSDTSLDIVQFPHLAKFVYEFVVSDPDLLEEFDKLSQEYFFSMFEYVAHFVIENTLLGYVIVTFSNCLLPP